MESHSFEAEAEAVPTARGRYAFEQDEGFRVTFRRADGKRALLLAWLATFVVVAVTLASLLASGERSAVAWMIAALLDGAAIYVFFALQRGLSRGGISVDGAMRRVYLPEGAELEFHRLVSVRVRRQGAEAELSLVHQAGEIAFGPRPEQETRTAASAVARVAEIPLEES